MKIPDDRLAIYHDLVVGGHRGMVGNVFQGTLAALAAVARHRPTLGRGTSHREIVEGFIEREFAATHSLRELANRFLGYLEERYRAAFRSVPLLGELGRFERLELDVDLVEDGPGEPATTESLNRLAGATIGRLLGTRVLVPDWLRMLRVRHDLAAAKALLAARGGDATLHEIVRPLEAVVIVTRNPATLFPVSETVPRATARDLRRFRAGAPFPIEQLAALRAERGPRGETEEESLERVVSETFGWLARGVLVFEPSRPARARRSRPARQAASSARDS
jgi:hypothetical protein